jgi:nicotinamide mononucleotide transporter
MFVFKGLYLTAALYTVFLVLAIMGYVQWKRSLTAREPGAGSREPSVEPA